GRTPPDVSFTRPAMALCAAADAAVPQNTSTSNISTRPHARAPAFPPGSLGVDRSMLGFVLVVMRAPSWELVDSRSQFGADDGGTRRLVNCSNAYAISIS